MGSHPVDHQTPPVAGAVKSHLTTGSHAKLRIKGRGIHRGEERGDQFVITKIVAPKSLDDDDKATIEKLQRKHPLTPRTGPPWS